MRSLMKRHQEKFKQGTDTQSVQASPVARTKTALPQGLLQKQQQDKLIEAAMSEDLKALSDIRSKAHKVQLKKDQLIPKYRSFVEFSVEAGKAHPIISQVMVWLFDAEEISEAVKLAEYCIKLGISLPERFKRPLPIYLADEVLSWAEQEWEAGRSPNPFFNQEFEKAVNDRANRPDELTLKYFRLAGLIAEADGRYQDAVICLESAMDLGAKVKTALNRCRSALEKSSAVTQ